MTENGTTSKEAVPGWFVEFQMVVLRNLPRDIAVDIADGWSNNGEALKSALRRVLMPTETGLPAWKEKQFHRGRPYPACR